MVILHWSMIASPKNLSWTFSQIWTASSLTRVFTKWPVEALSNWITHGNSSTRSAQYSAKDRLCHANALCVRMVHSLKWTNVGLSPIPLGPLHIPSTGRSQKEGSKARFFSSPTRVIYTWLLYIYITLRRFVNIARLYTTAPQILNGKTVFWWIVDQPSLEPLSSVADFLFSIVFPWFVWCCLAPSKVQNLHVKTFGIDQQHLTSHEASLFHQTFQLAIACQGWRENSCVGLV